MRTGIAVRHVAQPDSIRDRELRGGRALRRFGGAFELIEERLNRLRRRECARREQEAALHARDTRHESTADEQQQEQVGRREMQLRHRDEHHDRQRGRGAGGEQRARRAISTMRLEQCVPERARSLAEAVGHPFGDAGALRDLERRDLLRRAGEQVGAQRGEHVASAPRFALLATRGQQKQQCPGRGDQREGRRERHRGDRVHHGDEQLQRAGEQLIRGDAHALELRGEHVREPSTAQRRDRLPARAHERPIQSLAQLSRHLHLHAHRGHRFRELERRPRGDHGDVHEENAAQRMRQE